MGVLADCDLTSQTVALSADSASFTFAKDESGEGRLAKDSLLLLATDGIWSAMKNTRAISLLRTSFDDSFKFQKQSDCHTREEFCVRELCKRGSMLGGDDASAIAIFFRIENE